MRTRAGLDRAAVIQAAAALVDAEGLEALTLARLAEQLGVRTPSLYNHVSGLGGLQRDLAVRGMRDLGAVLGRAAIGKARDDAVAALACAYRDFVKSHPGLYAATLRVGAPAQPWDPELHAAGREVVDVVLAVLASYGLYGDAALHATRGLRSLVHGFATLEALGGFGLPLDCEESFRRLVRVFIAMLHHQYAEQARAGDPAAGPGADDGPRRAAGTL